MAIWHRCNYTTIEILARPGDFNDCILVTNQNLHPISRCLFSAAERMAHTHNGGKDVLFYTYESHTHTEWQYVYIG